VLFPDGITEMNMPPFGAGLSLPVDEIANELCRLLDVAAPQRQAMLDALRSVRGQLGEPGAPGRVARLAADLLNAA
jgi:hypothetical protein